MKLWIDLDNSPHVLLFGPIVRELEKRDVEVLITVREFAQTRELAQQHGLQTTTIGRHYGSGSTVVKVAGTFYRAAELAKFIASQRISAAVSHGSRSLVLASYALRIPLMTLYDYEYASCRVYNKLSRRILAPAVIPGDRLVAQGLDLSKLIKYPGLKEEVYVYGFRPNPDLLDSLGLDRSKTIVTVRPPAAWAHYHHEQSTIIFSTLMQRLKLEPDVQVVIPARTEAQERELRQQYALQNGKFRIFTRPVDGLSLMWFSDLVFSGGGTMTREAALLGMNVYTIFGGRMGAADESLIATGKLKRVQEVSQVADIQFGKRQVPESPAPDRKNLAGHIAEEIFRFANQFARC